MRRHSKIANASSAILIIFSSMINHVLADDGKIVVEDFSSKKMNWYAKNDPVMGGRSTSSVTVEDGLGKFTGEVVDVPFLSAPGFITMESRGGPFPDVSCCEGLEIVARASTRYDGYRFSFGKGHVDGGRFAFGFKCPFDIGQEFATVQFPFDEFSDNWDDATGDIKVSCAENKKFCPDDATLKDMGVMQFWGEGVNGVVDLEVKTVSAYGCTDQCGGYSARNGDQYRNGDNGGSRYGDDGNYGGYRSSSGGGSYNDGGYMRQPSRTQGSTSKDIKNTIAVPMAVIALLASFLSLFCICQMKSEARFKDPVPVLTADTAVEMD